MGIMDGKVCVVTGGGGSIGLAAAEALLREGARVLLVGRTAEKLEMAVTWLGSDPSRLDSIVADVADSADTRRVLRGLAAGDRVVVAGALLLKAQEDRNGG